MKKNGKILEILNDLIRINNDRQADYEKASRQTESKNADLGLLFSKMATESRHYASELSRYANQRISEPVEDTTLHGRIYRLWMDIKVVFSGHDPKTILAYCESIEDATQKVYNEALLTNEPELPAEIIQIIMDQKSSLEKSHDRIKRMRNTQPAV